MSGFIENGSVDWKDNYEEDTTDPQDGEEPFEIWWEDMRPREVRRLVKEAYERGFQRGKKYNQYGD